MEKYPKVIEINGALVALYPIEGLKAVSIDIRIKAGSWYEGKETWGKAHLMEHMMFQGTERFLDHDAMEVFKEEYGIWSNAWTGGSQIEVSLRMPSGSLKEGLELTSEMLFKLTIPEEALAKQKKVVAQEYEDRISRPTARFWKKGVEQLFGKGHLYTRDGIGEKDCFEGASREELLAYMRERVVPANMVIAIAGNFEVELAEKYLREMLPAKGEKTVLNFEKIEPNLERVTHFEEGMTTATIQMAWLTKGMEETTYEDRARMGLASYLLGGSARSVLHKTIREDLGLAYRVSSSTEYYPTVGWIEVNTSVKQENIEKVITEIQTLLGKFLEEPIENIVFERAKKYLVMQRQMAYESAMGTAGSLSGSLFWQGKLISPEEYEEIVSKIGEEEVRMAMAEAIGNQEPMVAIMMSR